MSRTFRIWEKMLSVSTTSGKNDRLEPGGVAPDYETFHRLIHALEGKGFSFGLDPSTNKHYPILNRYHRLGRRETPAGTLFVHAETFPVGCRFEFYQEVVTENRNGGRYDFGKRQRMPYLIGKAFEAAARAASAHLVGRGFVETVKVESPNPDPLAFFNQQWDSDYERQRGTHRFKRDEIGWPAPEEIDKQCWGVSDAHPLIGHGSVRYFRDRHGYLARGRCYGGINGMWLVVYGPGPHDYTHLSVGELFECDPRTLPRRQVKGGGKRLKAQLNKAVEARDFERAITLRDLIARRAA